MLLPYASYLRIYEPLEQRAAAAGPTDGVTLTQEHQTILATLVARSAPPLAGNELTGSYLLSRDGRLFACPVDLALRSWLALASFADDTDARTRALFFVRETSRPLEDGGPKRLVSPADAHIRCATWAVPRCWFLLVDDEERETYEMDGRPSIRYRTSLRSARERLGPATAVLSALIDDRDLMQELSDLADWLEGFADDSWLELDYAGVGGLLGPALESDRSAYEIGTAVEALQRRNFTAAGEAYGRFVERWRGVLALERAN